MFFSRKQLGRFLIGENRTEERKRRRKTVAWMTLNEENGRLRVQVGVCGKVNGDGSASVDSYVSPAAQMIGKFHI
jgi:hypothetical protein